MGLELSFRWEVVGCLIQLAGGEGAAARAQLQRLAQETRASGHVLNAAIAEQVLNSRDVPVTELPKLLYLEQ